MTAFNVLVIHYRNYISIPRVLQVLHHAGCRIHLFACSHIYARKSGYLTQYHDAPSNLAAFIESLKQFIETRGHEFGWIIPMDDTVILELTKRLDEPWVEHCLPVKASRESMDFLLSKFDFPLQARQHGLPVPQSYLVSTLVEARQAAERLHYPLVAKAREGVAGSAIQVIHNDTVLARIYETAENDQLLLQEFVTGQVGGVTALFDHGQPLCWASFFKVKTYPGDFGPAAIIRFVELPQMGSMLAKLGTITGFHGIGGVDFIQDEITGEIVLIEQHARPTVQIYYANQAGIAFDVCIRQMLLGKEAEEQQLSSKQGQLVYLFPQDLRRCIMDTDVRGLFGWLFFLRRWSDVPWKEPRLALSYFREILASVKRSTMQKLVRKVSVVKGLLLLVCLNRVCNL